MSCCCKMTSKVIAFFSMTLIILGDIALFVSIFFCQDLQLLKMAILYLWSLQENMLDHGMNKCPLHSQLTLAIIWGTYLTQCLCAQKDISTTSRICKNFWVTPIQKCQSVSNHPVHTYLFHMHIFVCVWNNRGWYEAGVHCVVMHSDWLLPITCQLSGMFNITSQITDLY